MSWDSHWLRRYKSTVSRSPHDPVWRFCIAALLENVQGDALTLAPIHDFHSDLIETLLNDYATINTAEERTPFFNENHVSAFIEDYSIIPLSLPTSKVLANVTLRYGQGVFYRCRKSALQSASFDPTLSSTPRSSQSSGFASMLSLQRSTAQKKKTAETHTEDPTAGDERRSSSSSWPPRQQLGLSIASYRTLSTDDSGSLRGSAMDWEPTSATINDGTAI